MKPLMIDLFAGLGGWASGGLAEGYEVVGFDIERHVYGEHRYPAQLVLQDVTTIHGAQFKDATLIVASPPCQAYSYRAMPWSRARALPPPDNTLFESCFRIQREAIEAAGGRFIPLVVENVVGAQKWVGRARGRFGSFYLWGDVPALLPTPVSAIKNTGGSWFNVAHNTTGGKGNNPYGRKASKDSAGGYGGSFGWDNTPMRRSSSKSSKRKFASAMIAKIPLALSRHIARTYRPTTGEGGGE